MLVASLCKVCGFLFMEQKKHGQSPVSQQTTCTHGQAPEKNYGQHMERQDSKYRNP